MTGRANVVFPMIQAARSAKPTQPFKIRQEYFQNRRSFCRMLSAVGLASLAILLTQLKPPAFQCLTYMFQDDLRQRMHVIPDFQNFEISLDLCLVLAGIAATQGLRYTRSGSSFRGRLALKHRSSDFQGRFNPSTYNYNMLSMEFTWSLAVNLVVYWLAVSIHGWRPLTTCTIT